MGEGKSDLALPLSDLEDYGRRLRSLKKRMNHTKKLFDSYKDDIGDGSVNDALSDFESNWEDGREDITQQLDALADMSDAVVREFNKLENELTKQVNEKMRVEDKRPKRERGQGVNSPAPVPRRGLSTATRAGGRPPLCPARTPRRPRGGEGEVPGLDVHAEGARLRVGTEVEAAPPPA